MPGVGFEPTCPFQAIDFKSTAYAHSATRARGGPVYGRGPARPVVRPAAPNRQPSSLLAPAGGLVELTARPQLRLPYGVFRTCSNNWDTGGGIRTNTHERPGPARSVCVAAPTVG
jgi:hypothetical protein